MRPQYPIFMSLGRAWYENRQILFLFDVYFRFLDPISFIISLDSRDVYTSFFFTYIKKNSCRCIHLDISEREEVVQNYFYSVRWAKEIQFYGLRAIHGLSYQALLKGQFKNH